MLNELAQKIYENAKKKGFYDEAPPVSTKLMLIVTEVAEACDADQTGNDCEVPFVKEFLDVEEKEEFAFNFETKVKNTFQDEMADIIIRTLDLCAHLDIDIDAHIAAKMRYNSMRPYKHGKKY